MKLINILALSGTALAIAQPHNHAHKHPARHGSPVKARDPATTETVAGPVVTVYELNGEDMSWGEVEKGLKEGKYVLVDDDKISTVVPKPSPTPKPTPSEKPAAKFFEKPTTSKIPTTTVAPPPPPPSTTSAAPKPTKPAPSSDSSSPSGGSGVDSDFPDGKIKCSDFPSSYGAVNLEYLKLGGWSGVQRTPDFSVGSAIGLIETAIKGEGCTKKSFCSYACPAGYQKSQWPKEQGSTKESIGGIYCNENGYLELTRSDVSTKLCEKGVGGVKIVSKLSQNAAVCRTDYPGSESETIPLNTQPGGTFELCNPDQTTYYQWAGAATSAQYYINNAGVPLDEACDWGVAGSNKGNWAPVNMGVGRAADGVTYISLFPNAPTNPDGKLNFNIDVKGDVSGSCSYKNGNYYSGGSVTSAGCTVGVPKGGSAYFEFS